MASRKPTQPAPQTAPYQLDTRKIDIAIAAIFRQAERGDTAALFQRATRHAAANPDAHREAAAALAWILGIIGCAAHMELLPTDVRFLSRIGAERRSDE